MKTILIIFILIFITALEVRTQTAAPFVFHDSYVNIQDIDIYGEKVAVVANAPSANTPFYLAVYENEQWTKLPTTFMNNGVLDTLFSSAYPKVVIAPNGDIWVAGKYLYQYKNEEWIVHKVIESDSAITIRNFELIQVTNENKLMVFCRVHGAGDIFTIDLDNPDLKLRKRKFNNTIIGPNSNYPFRSVFEIDGYTFSQRSTSYDPNDNESDFLVNTPDDTILQFKLPTPNGENGGRRIMQMFAENKDEIWIVTDNSEGSIELDKYYTCCAGVFVLRNLKDWEVVSDVESYPTNIKNGLNIPAFGIHKINHTLKEIMLGFNPASNFSNEMYLYNTETKTFTKTDWDIIVKNSVGFRGCNQRLTEFKLNHILEAFSKNERSMYFQGSDNFLKFKVDSKGNRWLMSQSFVLKTPPIMHPTSVAETDLNQQFRIVPNPASQTISLKGKTELLKEIEIVNLQGTTLIKIEGDYNNISIRPFANGVYFVRKILKDGRIHNSKFIKQ